MYNLNINYKRLFLVLFFSFFSYLSYSSNVNFKTINNNLGLSHNWVRCIYQDDFGYMWFGTSGALNRFDGISCKVYNIGNRNVNDIVKKNNQEFWICTDLGVYIFNTISEKLTHLDILKNVTILCILQENSNCIWFGANDGYYKYYISENKIQKFKLSQNEIVNKSNYINIIYKDSEKNIWFGTKNGLHVLKNKTKEFIHYIKSGLNSLSNNEVYSIIEDKNKRLWIGTLQGGLDVHPNLRNVLRENKFIQVASGSVMDICIDSKQNLWFGTGNGLGVFNLLQYNISKSPSIYYYKNNPNNSQSISENSIYSLYEDKMHDIWVGTIGSGVNMISLRGKHFNVVQVQKESSNSLISNIVNAIYEDEKYLWIGTEIGLDRYDKETKKFKHFQYNNNDKSSLKSNAIFVIKKLSDGNLWIGTWSGGISIYNYKTEQFSQIYPNKEGTSINNDNVFSIVEDNDKNVWIGTVGGGLNKYNMQTHKYTYYLHDKSNPNSIRTNFVNTIIVTKDNDIYLSASYSLEKYDKSIDGFIHYNIPDSLFSNGANNYITSLFEDSKGHLWIGTYDGLFYFNRKTKVFTVFYKTSLEINNTILGIEEDNNNNLWLSTTNGIVKFINGTNLPKNPQFLRFTKTDGIAGNEGKRRSIFKDKKNNVIYIGSSQGFTFFNPDSIRLNKNIPNIIIRSFQILNKTPNKNKAYFPLNINPNTVDKIELSYKNSDFFIDFSILNYLNSENNNYKYKLEGYDTEWIDAGNNSYATYTNIPEGKYVFKILASNNDGIWTSNPKILQIEIFPPWWKTLIFKIVIILLILFIIYIIIKIRISILQNQNKILEVKIAERTFDLQQSNTILKKQQQEIIIQNQEIFNHRNNLEKLIEIRTIELVKALDKAQESDRLKTAFLNNISHEIRTPMNAIMGFTSLIKDETTNELEKEKYIDIIFQSSNQLLSIITDIINISKIETQDQYINNKQFNLNELLLTLYNQFNIEINKKDIIFKYSFEFADVDSNINSDEIKIIEILSNLISNAIKFTEKGAITFGYITKNNFIEFFVEDTGIGIIKEDHKLIFERFRQVESNSPAIYGGTGLGLSISKAYVELLGGKIWLNSEINVGSCFKFTIPLVKNLNSLSVIKNLKLNSLQLQNKKSILVVEDEYFNFELIKEYLKNYNISLTHATTGYEAISFCDNQIFDLILMDIKMPVLNGFDTSIKIKLKNPSIPIIAQSAYSSEIDVLKANQIGITDFLIKPFNFNDLIVVLKKYLEIKVIN